jgi:hypothetical protein
MGRIKLNRNDYLNNLCACLKCNTVISQIDEITLCKCRSTYIRTVCWSLKQYCPTCFDSTMSSNGKPCAELTKSVLGGGDTIDETIVLSETKEKVESTAYVGQHLTPAPWNESTAETISDAIEKLTTEGRVISDELIALTVKEEEVTATAVKEHLAPSQLDEGGATNALEVLPVKEEDNLAVADVGETLTISTEGMQYNDPRDFVKCSSIDELRLKLQKGRICYTFYSA